MLESYYLMIKDKKLIFLISILFFTVFFHYIFNDNFRHWNVSIAFILIFIYFFIKGMVIKPNFYLIAFCCIGSISVTLLNHLLFRLDSVPENLLSTYKKITNQYIWFIPFIFLPTIYYKSHFNAEYFYRILFLVILFLTPYLLYWGIMLEFDRGLFSIFFNPVISYDIGFISLTILLLCYSFYSKGKQSYLYLITSLLCMFLLILHGTRGAWVGLLFVFAFLVVFYAKTELKKIILMLCLVISFVGINMIIPNSPLLQRVENFQSDSLNIQNNNYQNSSGIRLLLWGNSIEMFKSKPFTGIGMYDIEAENCRLYERGDLPHCFQHMHSIYFHELAANGLVGLIGLFMTFLVALIYFIKNIFIKDELIKNLAITGALFVIYYMCSGLTEYYLFFQNTTYVFYWIVASLMSFIYIHKLMKVN
ncbi:O-antigen ligase family protein [Acinetobacter bereziniae]|uniref:O-antigen ligase family protein n=1 Tax=Acinetobacter bereziniae TaxID=106648 RepID=UPI0021E44F73|nr:O-antigen ligase family protein [Acinetobacter bereziniae]MCV2441842.1 O-antigen ligase family protein [Acinetobacter bereziniae]